MSALMSSELTYGKSKTFLFDNMFALDIQYTWVMLKSFILFLQNARPAEVESVLLVLGQVHVTAYFNQDEDIGEEDQVLNPFVKNFWYKRATYMYILK